MSYQDTVKKYIIDNFFYGAETDISPETSFLGSNIIDSTGILEVVSFLQDTFNVTIGDDEMLPENLDSLENIEQFIRKMNGKSWKLKPMCGISGIYSHQSGSCRAGNQADDRCRNPPGPDGSGIYRRSYRSQPCQAEHHHLSNFTDP
jgi:acyl carrier protein